MNADDEDFSFDVVIVGAGPSAAGLLRGLLQRSLLEGGGGRSGIRIAVLERGGGCVVGAGGDETKDKDKEKVGRSRFDHPHPSTTYLSRWFEASHYSSTAAEFAAATTRECDDDDDDGNGCDEQRDDPTAPQSPTVLHATSPNRATNYRVMDVPTGRGWGGTTNVHAGLVMDPIWSSSSSSRRKRGEASWCGRDRDDCDVDREGGDFAVMWPGRWRGGGALRRAVREVRTALVVEEEEDGAPLRRGDGDEGGEIDELGACDVEFRPVFTSSSSSSSASSPSMSSSSSSSSADSPTAERTGKELAEGKEDGKGRRVNYFASLVEPLLRQHPELEDRVAFLPGMRAERILFDRTGRARGMECLLPRPASILASSDEDGRRRRRRRVVVRSRGEIVLCAGAIGSPALLLASGVGHEDDLGEAGIVPWYDRTTTTTTTPSEIGAPSSLSAPRADDRDDRGRPSSFHRTLPVGRNLRDHVLLSRVFVTPHRPSSRRWTFSRNSIRGTTTLDLSMNAGVGGSSSSSTTTRNFCGRKSDRARIQIQLADGGQMDRMIPHFAASAIRRWRRSYHCFLKVRGSLIRHLPFWDAARLVAINVCLMNPRSVGRVTVVCRRDDDDDDDDDGNNEEDRQEWLSDPNAVASRKCHTRSLPTRLSNCRVIIDPGYLTDPWDVDALYAGWRVSSEIKRHRFRGCTEILPGRFLTTVFALASLASSLIGWLASHFWYGTCVERKERCRGVIGCTSDRPSWFSVYVAEFANPYYHWCGTCTMGEDATEDTDGRMTGRDEISSGDRLSSFVVDERLRVRGIVGLRICDASVFPTCISAPTALTCAALGHAASTFILDADREIKLKFSGGGSR